MRQPEEFIEEAEFVHQLQGRRVDRVAAEVAEEVGVLLQDDDPHAGAGEQEPEHHPRRPAADDAALGPERLRRHMVLHGNSSGVDDRLILGERDDDDVRTNGLFRFEPSVGMEKSAAGSIMRAHSFGRRHARHHRRRLRSLGPPHRPGAAAGHPRLDPPGRPDGRRPGRLPRLPTAIATSATCSTPGRRTRRSCLCWRNGQRSPIHNHRGSNCGVKVLRGVATETTFARAANGMIYAVRLPRPAGRAHLRQRRRRHAPGVEPSGRRGRPGHAARLLAAVAADGSVPLDSPAVTEWDDP